MQSSGGEVRPRHRAQPPPQAPPHQPRAHTLRTGRATSPACRGRTIGLVDLHPQGQPSARAAHPRGSASQGHLTHTHAPIRATTPAHVRSPCCPALRVRRRRSAGPDSPGSLPSRSQESPSQQPRNLENLRLSGGTSGRYWAASAGSLRAYRRPSGQSLWDSWTPRPTCGVCVTTTLLRCPNGARDR